MLGVSSTVACSAVAELKAKMKFREANAAYQSQNYEKAIELYEETLRNDPSLTQVYFYLRNSYDNLYRPGLREADPANEPSWPRPSRTMSSRRRSSTSLKRQS
jgi:tetratricopeptide (TPR) repeat protein